MIKSFLGEMQNVTTFDNKFNKAIDDASSIIDRLVRPRFFVPFYLTARQDAQRLTLVRVLDLLDLISFTVDTRTYAASSDIANLIFDPFNGPPYETVSLPQESPVVESFGFWDRGSLTLTGFWGYCKPPVLIGTLSANLNNSDLTFVANASVANIATYVGRILRIDNELFYVQATSSTNTFVVTRYINGSLAATHSQNASIYVWDAVDELSYLCRILAVRIVTVPQLGTSFLENSGKIPFGGVLTQQLQNDIEELSPVLGN